MDMQKCEKRVSLSLSQLSRRDKKKKKTLCVLKSNLSSKMQLRTFYMKS